MNSSDILPLTIRDLLSEGKYIIPIYQRNYDWGERESLQLIQDIADYAVDPSKEQNNYYLGSLVVFIRNKDGLECFETIDGQQRLTTLTILMCVLKDVINENDKLKDRVDFSWFTDGHLIYDHRPESVEALKLLFSEEKKDEISCNSNIIDVFKIIKKQIIILDNNKILDKFVEYLLSKVIIIRIPVPRDTDLNHYFEVMNSRGEQLEKHEVLKASLMDSLPKDDNGQSCTLFNEIWEACSSLSSYVQMNFNPHLRNILFSDNWTNIPTQTFDDILNTRFSIGNWDGTEDLEGIGAEAKCLRDLFDDADKNKKYESPNTDNRGENERFGSIINFPNFLLHALKIIYFKDIEYDSDIHKEIKLDDKRLLEIFALVMKKCTDKSAFVKRFIMELLKLRILFDRYIIKRESYNEKEGWSLKNLKKYEKSKVNYVCSFNNVDYEDEENDIGRDIRMLESMFHVSAPTQIYKHWLNATLLYIYQKQDDIDSYEFRDYLYRLACTYMLDRYLCERDKIVDFDEIIYKDFGDPQKNPQNNKVFWQMIDQGCNVENFVFNFYDYVIWKKNNVKYKKFEFSYRTSVEHFYPRHPMLGYDDLRGNGLDDFGNLCLISRSMNSKFSNNMPKAKVENFGNEVISQELSIKLNEMMEYVKEYNVWGKDQIKIFESDCRTSLLNALKEKFPKIDVAE